MIWERPDPWAFQLLRLQLVHLQLSPAWKTGARANTPWAEEPPGCAFSLQDNKSAQSCRRGQIVRRRKWWSAPTGGLTMKHVRGRKS